MRPRRRVEATGIRAAVVLAAAAILVGAVAAGGFSSSRPASRQPVASAAAQGVPADVRPFVSLRADAVVEVYEEPVVRDEEVISRGRLVERRRRLVSFGSGTVIGDSGLILTSFHVYDFESLVLDARNERLLALKRLDATMLVYALAHNDPFRPPERRWVAEPVCLDPERDLALLRIVGDADGTAGGTVAHDGTGVPDEDGAPGGIEAAGGDATGAGAVELANPYDLEIQGDLTILGYSAKGGANLMITAGKFLNYANDIPWVRDGALITDASIAGGNSGGAALHGGRLVGVPTQVSPKAQKGFDYGYLHPVSWTVRCLAEAEIRHGVRVPELPEAWVLHRNNPDTAAERIFAGGKVVSANSGAPVEEANVLIHRADRETGQIFELFREVAGLAVVLHVKRLAASGLSAEQIAERYEELGIHQVRQILALELDPGELSADARRFLEGEFFYAAAETGDDGFFILPLPREGSLRLVVIQDGYRAYEVDLSTGAGLWQDLGPRRIYREPF